MRGKGELSTALAIAFSCVLLLDPLSEFGFFDWLENYGFDTAYLSGPAFLGSVPPFLLVTSKMSRYPFVAKKGTHKSRRLSAKISIFKGRGAKLTFAIFNCLETNGDLTISEIQRHLNKQKNLEGTYYGSISKRVHCLETAGYIVESSWRQSQSGFRAKVYKLHVKAHLAIFLNQTNPETVLDNITENNAAVVLSTLVRTLAENQRINNKIKIAK
jgi:hypothetical protein